MREEEAGGGPGPLELEESLYGLLRELAGARIAGEERQVSLRASDLVQEAWLRLLADAGARTSDRGRFRAAAASAVRRALLDHVKRRRAGKRGGGARRVTLETGEYWDRGPDLDFMAVHEALEALSAEDPALARHVELRVFGGATREEVATELEIPLARVDAAWEFARRWLARRLAEPER